MACLVDGRSYTLLACRSVFYACLDGHHGCQWPHCCINGILYCPWLSSMPMMIGSPLHVMRTSSSLNTLTPSFLNTKTVLSSDVLPTLIRDVGKSWNVSACLNCAESVQNGSWMTYFALLTIGNPNPLCRWSQNREACFALVLFADVVSVGPRVVCQHDTRG